MFLINNFGGDKVVALRNMLLFKKLLQKILLNKTDRSGLKEY